MIARKLAFLVLLAAFSGAGCQIALDGVPIMERAGEPAPRDDAGTGPDDVDIPAGDPVEDDFDRDDGPVAGGKWRAGEQGTAEIWDGRLCLEQGGTAILTLPEGRYAYVRMDVPGELGLEIQGRDQHGIVFALNMAESLTTHDGVPFGSASPLTVAALEVELNYPAQQATMGFRDGERVTVPLVEGGLHTHLTELRFVTQVGAPYNPSCVDNVYVAEARPLGDPFAKSAPVNACVPDGSAESRCVARHCCTEIVRSQNETCPAACDPDRSCECDHQLMNACATRCIQRHPSGSFDDCTYLCRRQLQPQVAGEVVSCIETHCAQPAREPTVELGPLSWPEDPPGEPTKHLALNPLGDLQELLSFDFARGETTVLGELQVAWGEEFVLFADSSHRRIVASGLAGDRPQPGRVLVWKNDRFVELELPQPIAWATPSPSRRYIFVATERSADVKRQVYLFTYDGRLLYRSEPEDLAREALYTADESLAILPSGSETEQRFVKLDFVMGAISEHTLEPSASADTYWTPIWAFPQGLLWLRGDEVGFTSYGSSKEFAGVLPVGPAVPTDDGKFLRAVDGIYVRGPAGPERVAAPLSLPPLAVDATRLLSGDAESLVLSDRSGVVSDTLLPGDMPDLMGPAPARWFTTLAAHAPSDGLLVTTADTDAFGGERRIYDFTVMEGEFSLKHVLTVPSLGEDTYPASLVLYPKSSASAFVIFGNGLHHYDVLTGTLLSIPTGTLSLHACPLYGCLAIYGSSPW